MREPATNLPDGEGSALRRTLGLLVWWSPAWVPLLLAAHLAFWGLDPAREEYRRLLREEPVVERRLADSAEKLNELDLRARAWNDPVYLERYRLKKAAEEQAAHLSRSETTGGDAIDGAAERPR